VLASPKVREKEVERKETVSVAVVPLTLPVPYEIENWFWDV
jgi:hypothetical protein